MHSRGKVNIAYTGELLTGRRDDVAEVVWAFARVDISHLQVRVFPHSLAGVEAFEPVLEALDQTN